MKQTEERANVEVLHCAICGRQLTPADLQAGLGGGLLLCGYCRAREEACGCGDE